MTSLVFSFNLHLNSIYDLSLFRSYCLVLLFIWIFFLVCRHIEYKYLQLMCGARGFAHIHWHIGVCVCECSVFYLSALKYNLFLNVIHTVKIMWISSCKLNWHCVEGSSFFLMKSVVKIEDGIEKWTMHVICQNHKSRAETKSMTEIERRDKEREKASYINRRALYENRKWHP